MSSLCAGSSCEPVTGQCSCAPGYTGPQCDKPCAKGFYGIGCRQACPPCTSSKQLYTTQPSMVLILDGNSSIARRSNDRDCSLRAHLFLLPSNIRTF